MKKLQKSTKIALIVLISIAAILIGIFAVIKLTAVNTNSENTIVEPADEGEDKTTPKITAPDTLTVEILDFSQVFDYSVKNANNYDVSIIVDDTDVAEIDESNKIVPKSIGTTSIVVIIKSSPVVKSTTILNIIDCTKIIGFKILDIDGKETNTYFAQTPYYLKIEQNVMPSEIPEILYSDNVVDFTYENISNNDLIFSFKIETYGEFSFEYLGKYVNFSKSYHAYIFPAVFNVNFNLNATNDTITLYLFDENYTPTANADNIFSSTSFEIETLAHSNDVVTYDLVGSSITISDGIINAQSYGTTNLTFTSSISGVSKTYYIEVKEVEPNALLYNGDAVDVGSSNTIELGLGETFFASFSITPIYCLGKPRIIYDDNLVLYDGEKFTLLGNNPADVCIKYNDITFLTLHFIPIIQIDISYTINLGEYANCIASFDESNLTIYVTNFTTTAYINLYFYLYVDGNLTSYMDDYSQSTVATRASASISNNVIALKIVSTGNCILRIYNNDVDFEIEINIVVTND